ncbi:NADH-quinone oxidoreductase subunit J [Flavobacterium salilacus subsp. salilacus]|uniref:NADH-quinone oxidoreductase subunit J family protein n=1 Tax=Flavobacterium TaxID=237 RepID=UPI0010754953|nr:MULTISPECIES: NADH-quinone oxidoreductase subunit J [Flavobacterium]KAF2520179.1 NADH-quinone oxidoreductase subunit J [Flavobacterium salilacus subsp. salilacus]MBE1613905.1 NADH-quinone oxidoreductase subunit J [Flavobacterium sp. SaA2.13]NDI97986.1 NADH-quinone oxidoreductase subunit J [Flavobacterium salilacus subsp. altitudinum]
MITTLFYILSAITLATAFLTIFSKNPIHSAIYLVLCFFSIAGHYLMFNAQFLAIVHIIVYSGAIMILMLFTIMLMNLNKEDEQHKSILTRIAATISFCLIAFVLLAAFIKAQPAIIEYRNSGEDYQSIEVLGQVLLNDYMVPFEFASVLLLVSMIGAVLLSKKEHIND